MRLPMTLLFTAAAGPALAQDVASAAKAFGAREAVQQISLSPDGKRIAVVAPVPGGTALALLVGGVDGEPLRSVLRSSGAQEHLRSCRWSTDTRLVCTVTLAAPTGYGLVTYTRMLSLNADGTDVKQLTAPSSSRALGFNLHGGAPIDWQGAGGGGTVLMTRNFVRDNDTGTRIANRKNGLGVESVDTTTLQRTIVEAPNPIASEYITDGRGRVRVRGLRPDLTTGGVGDTISYQYRAPGSDDWRPLGAVKLLPSGTATGFDPSAVDRDLNVVYGFDDQDGRRALFRVALDGTGKRELVEANPQVDVDGLVRIGRQRRVVGVSYATDRRQTRFFDPELKRLAASLSKALPGLPLVSFVDASADEKKLLLWAGSDVDPGRYYLYHKDTRELNELLPARPQLAGVKLAPVRAVTFPAADGTPIPGYLTMPTGSEDRKLPAIVMPHGGPGARDEWGFDWLAQFFAARGYAVLQPNFRGSTGYGERWFQHNGFQSWRTAVGDVNNGGRWLVKQGVADPARLAILGWSYGGYAALQSAVLDPELFRAIVAIAPVTDLNALREESRNFSNFTLVDRFIGSGPHVREGSPAQNAARIKAPVLLVHGDQDQNVGVGESRLMADRLRDAGRKVEYLEFKGLDHQLDDDGARTEMLGRADAFLRAALKTP